MSLDQRFADAMGHLLGPDFPGELGLAVSGGGDSMAMLALAHNWARRYGVSLKVATVDHGLRVESAREAEIVAAECRTLGHPHSTLVWNWDGHGNKLDAARRGRMELLDGWRGATRHVLLGHTRDDIAEGFLMRLTRRAGTDGLSAMAATRNISGMVVVRPCLEMSRADLRHYATVLKVPFVDDPSNDDPRYDRARMRRLLGILEAEGLSRTDLACAAEHLRDDRDVLRQDVLRVWHAHGTEGEGVLWLDPDWHVESLPATQRRLLNACLRWVSGAEYGPRSEALSEVLDRVVSGGGATLHGCELAYIKGRLAIFREYRAIEHLETARDERWDGRWRFDGAASEGRLGPLGDRGWEQLSDDARRHLPYKLARVTPAFWQNDRLRHWIMQDVGAAGTSWHSVTFPWFIDSH